MQQSRTSSNASFSAVSLSTIFVTMGIAFQQFFYFCSAGEREMQEGIFDNILRCS